MVGAITARGVWRVEVLVIKNPETGEFFIFSPDGREAVTVEDEGKAMGIAEDHGVKFAWRLARESGGTDVDITTEISEFKHGRGRIDIVAVGDPG